MPRKYSKGKRGARKGGSRKQASGFDTAMGYAKQALKTAKWVAALVNAESKYDDTTVQQVPVSYDGTITTLANPSQGDTAIQRNGDSIKLQHLSLRGYFYDAGANSQVRLMCIHDKQNTVNTIGDLLQVANQENVVHSPKNEDNKYQTKVLYDNKWSVYSEKPVVPFEVQLPLGFHTNFSGGTTTIKDGALKLAFCSSTVSGGTNPGMSYYSRVTYLDN